jgi:tetratricopeptide (TPR) repeat protein
VRASASISSPPVSVPRSVAVGQLLRALPPLEELDDLRLSLLAVAEPDPSEEWDRARAYQTVDRRVLDGPGIEIALQAARQEIEQRLDRVFSAYSRILREITDRDEGAAARALIALGEEEEAAERYPQAAAYFESAAEMATGRDKEALILALRRVGRVKKALGDFASALQYYRRSLDLAVHAGDLHGETVARIGIGNVLTMQYRFPAAEASYLEALACTEPDRDDMILERAQVYNNLALVANRMGKREEAEERFQQAIALWTTVDAPVDLQSWYYNRGIMRLEENDVTGAEEMLRKACDFPITSGDRALIVADLAEIRLRAGDARGAVQLARTAEQHAAARRSPYVLGEVYKCLGNIARDVGDADGFTFYEKSLELARLHSLAVLEANTLVDYARLRLACNGPEEASAYLHRAITIYGELGAEQQVRDAKQLLAQAERSPPVSSVA